MSWVSYLLLNFKIMEIWVCSLNNNFTRCVYTLTVFILRIIYVCTCFPVYTRPTRFYALWYVGSAALCLMLNNKQLLSPVWHHMLVSIINYEGSLSSTVYQHLSDAGSTVFVMTCCDAWYGELYLRYHRHSMLLEDIFLRFSTYSGHITSHWRTLTLNFR